jgi:hypothetical protein
VPVCLGGARLDKQGSEGLQRDALKLRWLSAHRVR